MFRASQKVSVVLFTGKLHGIAASPATLGLRLIPRRDMLFRFPRKSAHFSRGKERIVAKELHSVEESTGTPFVSSAVRARPIGWEKTSYFLKHAPF